MTISLCMAVAFFCSLFSASAAAPAEDVFALSSAKEEIRFSTAELLGHFTPMREDLPPAFARTYDSLAAEMFDPELLYSYALGQWTTGYDSNRAAKALAWLRSPAGKAIAAWEIKAYSADARKEILSYAKRTDSDKKLRKRIEGLEKTVENTAHSKSELVIVLSRQLIQIASTLTSTEAPLSSVEIGTMVEGMRPDLLDYYRGLTRGFYAYALRSASSRQLAAYAGFLAGEDGQWYERRRRQAITHAYHTAGARFVLSLKSAFDAIVEQPEDSTTTAYLNNLLKKRSANSKVLGVLEATAGGAEWVAYINAEPNPDSTLTLLALNSDRQPEEQIEITIPFKGTGVYRLAEHQGVYFRLNNDRTPLEVLNLAGSPGDNVEITGYDELQGVIEGTLHATFIGEKGKTIVINSKPFIVRIRR